MTDWARGGNVERADALAQPLRIGHRSRQRGVTHDLDELLAAIASEDIGGTQPVLHALRENPEHPIAGQVVELVVVALEEIEIDDANRERSAGEIGSLLRLFHGNEERATI